jgi:hypothetical protein
MVDYVVYGRGIFNQLDEIIAPHRKAGKPMIFTNYRNPNLVDDACHK